MNWKDIEQNWDERVDAVRARWPALTAGDIEEIAGNLDRLAARLRHHYGDVDFWSDNADGRAPERYGRQREQVDWAALRRRDRPFRQARGTAHAASSDNIPCDGTQPGDKSC